MNVDYLLASLEFWGGIFCFIGVFFQLVNRTKYHAASYEMVAMLLCSALMMASDLACFFFRGQMSTLGTYMVPIGNLLMFFLPYIDMIFFCSYLWQFSSKDENNKLMVNLLFGICATAVLLTIVSIFNNMYFYVDQWNYYHRGPQFWMSQAIGVCAFIVIFAMILYNRQFLGNVKFLTFTSYIIFPFIMHVVQSIKFTLISRLNLGVEISVIFILLVMIKEQNKMVNEQELKITEQEVHMVEQEHTINDMRIRLVLSQIQPHFLYNSLNAIYYLCEKDSAKAQHCINDFSDYLRGNMDALSGEKMIPLSKEIQHVRSYLSLEKMRFDDDLHIEFHIEAREFLLPALSLQPIVENAVKHGLGKKLGGGTVKVCVYDRGAFYELLVQDDGVGYDTNQVPIEDSRSHIGVENVRKRLEALCKGTLEIESTPGIGTTAIIRIPKNDMTEVMH
ncbi:MAG: histidine kinase [Lachnospiraceae bacterium]|nr:histidine kinase [Lachnospiraceae bacterium]